MMHFCKFSPQLTHRDLLIWRYYDAKVVPAKLLQRRKPNQSTAVQRQGLLLLVGFTHLHLPDGSSLFISVF